MLCVSFNSYKGGAGRTSTAMNVVPFLAERLGATEEEPILLIDADIDSAGLTFFLDDRRVFSGEKFDTKKLLSQNLPKSKMMEETSLEEHPFFKECSRVGNQFGLKRNAVLFLGVNMDYEYDYDSRKGTVDAYIRKFVQICEEQRIKAVVFDTASGGQFSSQISSKMSSVLVYCMRVSVQHRKGTFEYLKSQRAFLTDGDGFQAKKIIIVPTAVPNSADGCTREKRKKAMGYINQDIESKLKGLRVESNFLQDEDNFGIPEIESFKWTERILYRTKAEEMSEDERKACEVYDRLAQCIVEAGDGR